MPEKSLFLFFLVQLLRGATNLAYPFIMFMCGQSDLQGAVGLGWEINPEGGKIPDICCPGLSFLKGWGSQDFLLSGHRALSESDQGLGDMCSLIPPVCLANIQLLSVSGHSQGHQLGVDSGVPCQFLGAYLWDQKIWCPRAIAWGNSPCQPCQPTITQFGVGKTDRVRWCPEFVRQSSRLSSFVGAAGCAHLPILSLVQGVSDCTDCQGCPAIYGLSWTLVL